MSPSTVRPPNPNAELLVADAARVLAAVPALGPEQERMRTRFLGFLAEHGAAAATRDLRVGHLTASAVVLDASRSRVLLTLHALAGRWLQLGGHLEAGDATLAAAALREAAEESGMAGLRIDPVPLGMDWHDVTCRDPAGRPRASSHLDVTFLVVSPLGARHQISDESLDLRWFPLSALPDATDQTVRTVVSAAQTRSGRTG